MNTNRTLLLIAAVVLGGLFSAAPARAGSETDPIKLRIAGTPRAARAWERYDGEFEVVAGADVVITDLRFKSRGWRVLEFSPPATLTLAAGQTVRIPFAAMPIEPAERVGIGYRVDGVERDCSVRLDADYLADRTGPGRIVPDPRLKTNVSTLTWPERTYGQRAFERSARDAGTLPDDEAAEAGAGTAEKATAGRTIRVHGRFAYLRNQAMTVGDSTIYYLVEEPLSIIPLEVYDEDSLYDDLLATGWTDENGYFDISFNWDPCWLCEDDPDIYVEAIANNSRVDVQTAGLEWTYAWDTWVKSNFTGSDLDFGAGGPASNTAPAAHIWKTVNRAMGILGEHGYPMDKIDVQWPGDASMYNPYFNEIHISQGREWNEGTYLHELGHYWQDWYAWSPTPDYCNGYCDEVVDFWFDDCGHCAWCQENDDKTIQMEGFANYVSYLIGGEINDRYDPDIGVWRYTEYTGACQDDNNDPCPCDPFSTEGFITAFLVDLADENNENDTRYESGWSDVTTMNPWAIMDVADIEKPQTVVAWYGALAARFPELREEMWETGMNSGLDFDAAAPSQPATAWVYDHEPGVPSFDATLEIHWDTSEDDASGVAGYIAAIAPDEPMEPSAWGLVREHDTFVSDPLPTGTWYVTVRAIDRDGNLSETWAVAGPYVVRDPLPADLSPYTMSGWTAPIIPYNDAYTSGPLAPPAVLENIYTTNTIFAFACQNIGEATIPGPTLMDLSLDGQTFKTDSVYTMADNTIYSRINYGARGVGGGRHTLGLALDAGETVGEQIETNNNVGGQYVWNPYVLTNADADYSRVAPPEPLGGVEAFASIFYNADGYRFENGANWEAVTVYPWDFSLDYDLRLHQPSTGSSDGFGLYDAYSRRPAGELDAVIIHRASAGQQEWDIGVLGDQTRPAADYSAYTVRRVTSQMVLPNVPHEWYWTNADLMSLKEFRVFTTDANNLRATLTVDDPTQRVHLAWLDDSFVTGNLDSTVTESVSGPATGGQAEISVYGADLGYHCLAVYRDPSPASSSLHLTLVIEWIPANLTRLKPDGWDDYLVPTVGAPGAASSTVLPDTLYGNAFDPRERTYFNFGMTNDGGRIAYDFDAELRIDGQPGWSLDFPELAVGGQEAVNWDTGRTIRGGRHMVSVHFDPLLAVPETTESDNFAGNQFVWSPLELTFGVNTFRPAPPDQYGGRSFNSVGRPTAGNCDGLRIPVPPAGSGVWQAVAVMPEVDGKVDLVLHDIAPGILDGFSDETAVIRSQQGPGQLDYVLIDNGVSHVRAYDVGVYGDGKGNGYHCQAVTSTVLDYPSQTGVERVMAPLEFLHLYEVELKAGTYRVDLGDLGGDADWGLSVHAAGDSVAARGDAGDDLVSWLNGAGQDESVSLEAIAGGRYCIAAWKTNSADLQSESSYRLSIGTYASGVTDEDGMPAVRRSELSAVYPNPCNPRTTVRFALKEAGPVDLRVYDVRGKLVRTLAADRREAGHHEAVWNGVDDHGRAVASGMYLVRLRTADMVDVKRVALIE